MPEKLDLFELTVKRGLENLEMPLDKTAWSNFENALDGSQMASVPSNSVGFLSKFGIAAAVLIGAVLFINISVQEKEISNHGLKGAQISTEISNPKSAIEGLIKENVQVTEASEAEISKELLESNTTEEVLSILSPAEKERMERINSKLQKAAEVSEAEKSKESEFKTGTTTRYLGADFNLGAPKSFTPDNDGKNDTFMPETLEEGDLFLMTIVQENGNVVFTTSDVSLPWNGRDTSDVEMEEGRYSWEVVLQTGDKKEIFKGTVNLLR
ncbi:MAG: hypothetical protein HKN45_05465 [Flavobacteriales bacterium]|nr:hypothetical protein [Flavobacteriales bacterium]NNK80385.1 hypothetical protein [Flavobacteriales bacterium]